MGVRENQNGDNVKFKLSNNEVVSLDRAISMCEQGELPNYNVGTSKPGTKYIRGNADDDSTNNLDQMPTF